MFKKKVGDIVANIVKMRDELTQAISQNEQEIQKSHINIAKAETVMNETIQKAEEQFDKKETKEQEIIDSSQKEIDEANNWLSALPSVE